MNKTVETTFLYMLAGALSNDKKEKKDKLNKDNIEMFSQLIVPFQSKVKEYQKSNREKYAFGLLKSMNPKDSSVHRTVYIFNNEPPYTLEKELRFSNKSIDDLVLVLMATYGDKETIEMSTKDFIQMKEIKENPIYSFILEDQYKSTK